MTVFGCKFQVLCIRSKAVQGQLAYAAPCVDQRKQERVQSEPESSVVRLNFTVLTRNEGSAATDFQGLAAWDMVSRSRQLMPRSRMPSGSAALAWPHGAWGPMGRHLLPDRVGLLLSIHRLHSAHERGTCER
jgi:hypothetical protein